MLSHLLYCKLEKGDFDMYSRFTYVFGLSSFVVVVR